MLLPRLASAIDTKDRASAVKLALSLQFFGVLIGAFGIYLLSSLGISDPSFGEARFLSIFVLLVFGGILGSLGASLMDIAIANDLAPSVFEGKTLAKFNSRFRQIDLLTEVGAPVLAGLLLVFHTSFIPLTGFFTVALWNLLSFFPEYGLLHSIFKERPDLRTKPIQVNESTSSSFVHRLFAGWKAFFREPSRAAIGV